MTSPRSLQTLLHPAALAATHLCAHTATAQVSLELLPGIWNNFGISINQDGSRIVGTTGVFPNYQPFIWERNSGLRTLPLPTPAPTIFYAASPDGQSIEGGFVATSNSPAQRFRTTDLEAPREIVTRTITGYGAFQARALSNGGTYTAGEAIPTGSSSGGSRAFRWSQANGFESLGRLTPSDFNVTVTAMSHDGNTIVGTSSSSATSLGYRWTPSTGMQMLNLPPGSFYTNANDCSIDGSVIAGYATITAGGINANRPVVWTNGVASYLPFNALTHFSGGVTRIDGSGQLRIGLLFAYDGPDFRPEYVIWQGDSAPILITDLLAQHGVAFPAGAQISRLSAFSDNGTTIVGTYTDALGQTGTFIATIPTPSSILALSLLGAVNARRGRPRDHASTRPAHPQHS